MKQIRNRSYIFQDFINHFYKNVLKLVGKSNFFFGIIKKTEEKIKYDRPSNEERGQFSTGQNCHRAVTGEYVHFENFMKCKTLQFSCTICEV